MKCKVKLNTINDVGLFVAKCGEYKDVDIDYVYSRYTIDVKSIMGILSTSFDKECVVNFLSDDEKLCNQFKEDIRLWIVEE